MLFWNLTQQPYKSLKILGLAHKKIKRGEKQQYFSEPEVIRAVSIKGKRRIRNS